ncbi:Hint domain-containing protein [Psychrobacter sp. I-STPA10]|uniref:Hint domain-containing protein n=1 Tax=Psychrobacter sp. I-STPA10 TaxID=2585769 RepID=UPI001E5B64D4|nr:Hint domain-containing protein [Psychrobacter sp. I-STPA10]
MQNNTNNAMYAEIKRRAIANTQSSNMACFVGGTWVSIPEFPYWKPIKELKVGDMVMAMPENGIGERTPKRVINTFKHEAQAIWYLGLSDLGSGLGYINVNLAVTPNHPFMVYGYTDDVNEVGEFANVTYYDEPRWKRVDQLMIGDLVKSSVHNEYYTVCSVKPLYQAFSPDYAYLQGGKEMVGWQGAEEGFLIDFCDKEAEVDVYGQIWVLDDACPNSHVEPLSPEDSPAYPYYDRQGYTGAEASGIAYPLYTTTVYNIEVEDYHTYCVAGAGILVHGSGGLNHSLDALGDEIK